MIPSNERLLKLLDKVKDEETFLEFATALVADREEEIEKEALTPSSPYSPGANGWENTTVEAHLAAAISWAVGMNFGRNRFDGKFNSNPWNQFANFLHAGKIYE